MHLSVPIRSDKLSLSVLAKDHVCHRETRFQTIDVYDTAAFGRMLLLDGHVQLAELDEAAYHESLVHVPLLSVPSPKSALVVGGGDGGVIRELCRWDSMVEIDLVDIDEGVIEVCREHLPQVSAGAFDDPRVKVHIADAFGFVRDSRKSYDLIVVDCTDVYEEEDGGLSEQLFTDGFYRDCLDRLSETGFVVTQADNLLFCPYSLEAIRTAFERVFPLVGSYWGLVPSFGGFSGYCWASRGPAVQASWNESAAVRLGLRYLNASTYAMGQRPLPFEAPIG